MKQVTGYDIEELSSPSKPPTKESAMRVMMLHTGHGFKTVVMGDPGRKWTPYVEIEYPVRLRKITNADAVKYGREIGYPLKKACREFIRFGREAGITKGAKTLLKGAWA